MPLAKLQQWLHPRRRFEPSEEQRHDKLMLLQEVRRAHADWVLAQHRLDYALEEAEIDYAIFMLEAAEKRYEMLIKSAKKARLSLIDSEYLMEAGR